MSHKYDLRRDRLHEVQNVTPTALLLIAAAVAVVRSRRLPGLIPAARALCALLLFDLYHHACRSALAAREAGVTLTVAEVWALRLDGAIVAGGWCAAVAWLLRFGHDIGVCAGFFGYVHDRSALHSGRDGHGGVARIPRKTSIPCRNTGYRAGRVAATCGAGILIAYGVVSVAVARLWPAAWMPLLIAPRFAVGALAWRVSRGNMRHGPASMTEVRPAMQRGFDSPRGSQVIGQIIAACQVGAAAFLWSRWGDVRLLSSACWAACAWIAWRAEPYQSA